MPYANRHVRSTTGPIPSSIEDCTALRCINLRNNRCTGTIPTQISCCVELEELSLAANKFTGRIPRWFANLPRLRELQLSGNLFTGEIPPAYGSAKSALRFVDVADNRLSNTGKLHAALANPKNGLTLAI